VINTLANNHHHHHHHHHHIYINLNDR
jgi:hypothetical protein